VHASWLNQVEIYFSVVQRKALTPDNFTDLDAVKQRLVASQDHHNRTANPFDWTFTRTDLNDLLTRLGSHDPHTPLPLAAQPPTNQRAHPLDLTQRALRNSLLQD
jgi:hypothetical protein